MMTGGYFTYIFFTLVLPVYVAMEGVFQMTKCVIDVEPAWTLLARLTVSDALQCARACHAANGTCDHISFYLDACMLWQGGLPCGMSHAYVVGGRCESGWHRHRGSCYRPAASPATWTNSVDHCATLGAHLVSTTSPDEEALVVDLVSSTFPSWTNIWVGASDLSVDGVWEWVSGEPWGFENWKSGEPSGIESWWSGKIEDCVEIEISTREKKWNDVNCEYNLSFVCEKYPAF